MAKPVSSFLLMIRAASLLPRMRAPSGLAGAGTLPRPRDTGRNLLDA